MRIWASVAVVTLLALAVLAYFRLWPPAEPPWDYPGPIKHPPEVSERMEADARKKLAFEPLAERLPRGKPIPPTRALSPEAKERWEKLDKSLAQQQESRAQLLKELHERTRKFFIESPGEGPIRRMITPEEILLDVWHGASEPALADQPGEPAVFPNSPGETLTRVMPDNLLHYYHDISLSEFLYPKVFGYVKDRTHVAGFKPHGFRGDPFPAWRVDSWRWRIQHIQLVGILSHEKPLVYLTDKLPSMEQVRKGKTRPLDHFEEAALHVLREGEDLYLASKGATVRMLGALRATKTCQQCHDAGIGDLLGAFSYTLRHTPDAR